MIKKEIRRAKHRKDWDLVKKLIDIQQAEFNLRQSQMQAKLNLLKSEADIKKVAVDAEKVLFDRKISLINTLLGSGLLVWFINVIKDLPIIKQFFK